MKRSCAALTLLLALLLSCTGCARSSVYSVTWLDVFDTVTVFTAAAPSRAAFDAYAETAHTSLLDSHRRFDIYHEYDGLTNLCTVNRLAGAQPVAVDGDTMALLELGKSLYEASTGKLNLCMGGVLTLWHDAREAGNAAPENASLPDDSALQEAAAHMDPAGLLLDRENGTVAFADPLLRLDVGAIAKGWAAGRACEALKDAGCTSFLLNAGGNVCAVGARPDGGGWRVGVTDPFHDGTLKQLRLQDACAVTSGSYQRYYTVDGVSYHHIIDPDTRYPAPYYTLVTVVAADSALADALSTALFCLPQDEGRALAEAYGAEALWCFPDGTLDWTAGFSAYLSDEAQ